MQSKPKGRKRSAIFKSLFAAAFAAANIVATAETWAQSGGSTEAGIKPAAATVRNADAMEVRAQVTPRYATTLSSEIVGRIVSLPVREGENFVEGQELAAIDCASYEARRTQADAQMRRNERKAQALRLLDQRGATGKVELELAEIDVAASRAERQLATIDVSRCTISAPFSGSVTALKVKNHQYVPVGEQIISILSNRELEVEMLVPSRWLAWLATGQHFNIHIDELDQDFPASVTRVAADIDPVSQSVKVFATVTGDFPSLSPGMSGLARFNIPEPEPVQ